MRIGITGAEGMIGWHLRCHLHSLPSVQTFLATRRTFASDKALIDFVQQCDAIVHLAGVNRGDPSWLEHTNVLLTEQLIKAMNEAGRTPIVVFASSTHIDRNTPYGRSKRAATLLLKQWADQTGGRLANVIFPHVFGEAGKPFYNSVVSTFCYQLSVGNQPSIENDGDLDLLHAQEVASIIVECARNGVSREVRPHGARLRVSQLLARLSELATLYRENVIPSLNDPLDLRLFNTLRYYLFPSHYPVLLDTKKDARGWLIELVRTFHGGQSFVSSTRPGATRGNHFHFRKLERFLVVSGSALIRVRRLFDNKIHEFEVSGDNPGYIDIPTLHTHNITNIGTTDLFTMFWSHELFNKSDPDTYTEPV